MINVSPTAVVDPTVPVNSNAYVWNPNTLAWDRMEQPILNAGTVIIPGTVTVTGTVAISGVPHVIIDSATLGTVAVSGTFWQATQPVSAATLPLPSGASTSAKQDTIIAALASVPVTGPLTDAQLRALAVPVSLTSTTITGTVAATQSGAWDIGTVTTITNPVAVTNANLDVALSTRLKPADTLVGVTTVGTVTTITNPVAVTGTFWQVTQPISGSVTLASTTLTATVHAAGAGTVVDGRQVVTTAGTRVQMSAQACKVVAITAETDNTGVIVVGSETVVAAIATRQGTPLAAGDTAIVAVANMNLLYFDSTVNGDGVTWTVLS